MSQMTTAQTDHQRHDRRRAKPAIRTTAPIAGDAEKSLRIIDLPEVINRTSLRRSSVYRLIKSGELTTIKIGPMRMGFLESQVDAWIAVRVREAMGAPTDQPDAA